MKTLVMLISLLGPYAFGTCLPLYDQGSRGNSPKAKSLLLVRNSLIELDPKVNPKNATIQFSREIGVNPNSLQNILRRADKRGDLCRGGNLLDHRQIGNLIKAGRLL